MTARASIATIFLTMALVSMAGGITNLVKNSTPISYLTWFFIFFFILLRIKMYLDDLKDFKATSKLKLGMVFGIFSWFFWVVSAASIGNIEKSAWFLILAIAIANMSLFATANKNGFEKKHIMWFSINAIYMFLLGAFAICSFISFLWQIVIISICIVLTIFDFCFSDSLAIIDDMDIVQK
jgi:hypothetical protein